MNETWCNNCAKYGHTFNQCKIPITSFGCIVFRINPTNGGTLEYLMICRRYSIAYLEFVRGKYNLLDRENITDLFKQMTTSELQIISTGDFSYIWNTTWSSTHSRTTTLTMEEVSSRDKFAVLCRGVNPKGVGTYNLEILLNIHNSKRVMLEKTAGTGTDTSTLKDETLFMEIWDEPEWGFPKGRREYKENDYVCALREFQEETGINPNLLKQVKNIIPIEENFMGTNYKTYKHKYYLCSMKYEHSIKETAFQKSEVSRMEWKTLDECIRSIRPYNMEKKRIIRNIDLALHNMVLVE